MKPIKCLEVSWWVVPLFSLALGCQLLEGNRDSRSRSTGASRPAPAQPAPAAEPPTEASPAADNRTAAATEEDPGAPSAPCGASDFHYPEVKSACAEGGRSAVKKVMKGAIAKAKQAGTELKCSNCHVDQKTFGLRPNAVDDLKNWL